MMWRCWFLGLVEDLTSSVVSEAWNGGDGVALAVNATEALRPSDFPVVCFVTVAALTPVPRTTTRSGNAPGIRQVYADSA